MTVPLSLDFYGNIISKMHRDSIEYYLTVAANENQFKGDPELLVVFLEARDAVNRFIDMVYDRVDEAGGIPEEYEK